MAGDPEELRGRAGPAIEKFVQEGDEFVTRLLCGCQRFPRAGLAAWPCQDPGTFPPCPLSPSQRRRWWPYATQGFPFLGAARLKQLSCTGAERSGATVRNWGLAVLK